MRGRFLGWARRAAALSLRNDRRAETKRGHWAQFFRDDFKATKDVRNDAPRKDFCLIAATGAGRKFTSFSASWDEVVVFREDRTQSPEVTRHDITQYTIRGK